jgi:hypothetical protein
MVTIVVVGGGCGHAKPPPAPPVPIENATRSCTEAAAGLERATVGIRPPEESLLVPMRQRCAEDRWSGQTIDCFATMKIDDLGRCAAMLEDRERDRMFDVIAGTSEDRGSIAVARAKLSALKVGVAECDRFVSAVATVMTCEGMPIETRLQLGSETAEFWSLPTNGLSPAVEQRMSHACGESLQALQQQAIAVGCMP